jgi:hypothetical protein
MNTYILIPVVTIILISFILYIMKFNKNRYQKLTLVLLFLDKNGSILPLSNKGLFIDIVEATPLVYDKDYTKLKFIGINNRNYLTERDKKKITNRINRCWISNQCIYWVEKPLSMKRGDKLDDILN